MRAWFALGLLLCACGAPTVTASSAPSRAAGPAVEAPENEQALDATPSSAMQKASEAGARIVVELDDFEPVDIKLRPGAASGLRDPCEIAAASDPEAEVLEQAPACQLED